MQVNPATAYNMLSEFVDLQPGDWVVQNGANSAVRHFTVGYGRTDSTDIGWAGRHCTRKTAGIEYDQLHSKQVSFPNLIARIPSGPTFCRENFSDVEQYLKSLGATHVVAYDDLEDKSFPGRVKEWTGGKVYIDIVSRFHLLIAL